MNKKLHLLEVEINAEGSKLAYLSPIDDEGKTTVGYRISGPKALGGSKNIARLKIGTNDLVRYVMEYAPDVLAALTRDESK